MHIKVNVTHDRGRTPFRPVAKPIRTLLIVFLICLLVPAAVALAQENPTAAASPDNPFTTQGRLMYRGVKAIVLRSAEKMPEENYGFRPTDAVRTFGQILGHVADSQYLFCSVALGEPNPRPNIEKTRTSKADLIAALEGAFAYCDRAWDGMTDESATEIVKLMGRDSPRLNALNTNNLHTVEHYGNLVTYLRMNDIVPPSSEPEFMKEMMK